MTIFEMRSSQQYMRSLFDQFNSTKDAALYGLLSPSEKQKGKVSRTTFNKGVKPFIEQFIQNNSDRLYHALNNYLFSIKGSLPKGIEFESIITNPTVFCAIVSIFPNVLERVMDKYETYEIKNFSGLVSSLQGLRPNVFSNPGASYKALADILIDSMSKKSFNL